MKKYTRDVNIESLQRIAPLTQILWNEALEGRYWPAMTLNGYLHSVALQQNPEIALQALNLGAVAAGLSGKGPSTVAVADKEVSPLIEQAWKKSEEEKQINKKLKEEQQRKKQEKEAHFQKRLTKKFEDTETSVHQQLRKKREEEINAQMAAEKMIRENYW